MGPFSNFFLLLHLLLFLTEAKMLPLCILPNRSGLFVVSRDTYPQRLMATHLLSVLYDASHNVLWRNFCFCSDLNSKICYSRPMPLPKTVRQLLAIWWAGTQNCRPGSALGFLSCYFTGIQSTDKISVEWAQCYQSCKSTDHPGGNFLDSTISLRRLLCQVQVPDQSAVQR